MIEQQIPWWKKSIIYHIFLRSFKDTNGDGIGDIRGVISKLDYLEKLGINTIWLSPIYDSPQVDAGYDVRDYYAVHPMYGSMEDMEELIEKLHQRGMRLILDMVINHTSDEHEWFKKSRSSKNNPYRDYYFWRDEKSPGSPPNKWQSIFGGSAWEYDAKTEQYYLHLFHTKQPDLNWDNPEVRQSLYKMMRFWLDKGVDGFRLDAIYIISKNPAFPEGIPLEGTTYTIGYPHYRNGPHVHEYLQEMHQEVFSRYDIMTAGEAEEVTPSQARELSDPVYQKLNLILPFQHIQVDEDNDKWKWTEIDVLLLKKRIQEWHKGLEKGGWMGLYWTSHDIGRAVSRFGNDEEYREKSAKMLATCLFFFRATIFLYQGEELGMTNLPFESLDNFPDIETQQIYSNKKEQGWSHEKIMAAIRRKARDNTRSPMQWNAKTYAGFSTVQPWMNIHPDYQQVNAEAALKDPESIFFYYQKLLAIRKNREELITGDFDILWKQEPHVFGYTRSSGKKTLLIICNFTDQEVLLNKKEIPSHWEISSVLISNREDFSAPWNRIEPYEATVYEWKKM